MSRHRLPNNKIISDDMPFELEQSILIPAKRDEEGNIIEPQHYEQQMIRYLNGVRRLAIAERQALGITEIVDQPRPDERFYFVNENPNAPGQWIVTPRPLAQLKKQLKQLVKDLANSLILAKYPYWKQIKLNAERAELIQKRVVSGSWTANEQNKVAVIKAAIDSIASVTTHSDALENEIEALANVEAVAAWVPHDWPEEFAPADQGYAP